MKTISAVVWLAFCPCAMAADSNNNPEGVFGLAVTAAMIASVIMAIVAVVQLIRIPFILHRLVGEVKRGNDTLDLLLHVTRSNHSRQQNAHEENERA